MPERCVNSRVSDGVCWLELNRPDSHNAINAELIGALQRKLERLQSDAATRVVVVTGNGKSFCAGADLKSMQRLAASQMQDDAKKLATLLRILKELTKPTIARVNGSAYGGGVGLVACCDIAVAVSQASFSLSEVRLGLVPAVISPHVVAAIGERDARRYCLTGERFDAEEARRIGLVHEVVDAASLDSKVNAICEQLLQGAPGAIKRTKNLILSPRSDEENALINSEVRGGAEAQEGVAAFFEKRKPRW
jgi:methylglutaconyl-CoA hydratase